MKSDIRSTPVPTSSPCALDRVHFPFNLGEIWRFSRARGPRRRPPRRAERKDDLPIQLGNAIKHAGQRLAAKAKHGVNADLSDVHSTPALTRADLRLRARPDTQSADG